MSDKEHRNVNSKPGLEIGLRPELGTFELCDDHYDASRTESKEHCALCKLEAERDILRSAIQAGEGVYQRKCVVLEGELAALREIYSNDT